MEQVMIFNQNKMSLVEFQKAINDWLASKAGRIEVTRSNQTGSANDAGSLTITIFYKEKVK